MNIIKIINDFFLLKNKDINSIFNYNSKGWEAWLQIELFLYLNKIGISTLREETVVSLKPDLVISPNNFIELKVQGSFLKENDQLKEIKQTIDGFLNDCNKLSKYLGDGKKIALVFSTYSNFFDLLILKQYYDSHNWVLPGNYKDINTELLKISYNNNKQCFYNKTLISSDNLEIVKKIKKLPSFSNIFYYEI